VAGQPKARKAEGRDPDRVTKPGSRAYRWRNFDEDRPDDPLYPKAADYVASISTRHGAGSPRRVDPIAQALAAELLERRPDLAKYPEALLAWSRAESRCLLLESWFAEHGLVDPATGKATADQSLLSSSERLAMQLRERLGLDPKSEAELANVQADAARNVVDVSALRERGRQALRARSALRIG
jgi:hypothetical protein